MGSEVSINSTSEEVQSQRWSIPSKDQRRVSINSTSEEVQSFGVQHRGGCRATFPLIQLPKKFKAIYHAGELLLSARFH